MEAAAALRTTVLAIGLERYGDLSAQGWDVPGAAGFAIDVATWAISQGIPKDRIFLGYTDDRTKSPTHDHARSLGVRPAGTSSEQLLTTIETINSLGGDLLVVYWCGHGALANHSERRLFTSDARRSNLTNIRVDDLRCRLGAATPRASGSGYSRQVFLIDACAAEDPGRELPQSGWTLGGIAPRNQEIYFAGEPGTVAPYHRRTRTPLFSAELLRQLNNASPQDFPPDFAAAMVAIRRDLDQKARAFTGRPVFLLTINNDGELATTLAYKDHIDAAQVSSLASRIEECRSKFPELFARIPRDVRRLVSDEGPVAVINLLEQDANSTVERGAVSAIRDYHQRLVWVRIPLDMFSGVSLSALRDAARHAQISGIEFSSVETLSQTLVEVAGRSRPGDPKAPLYRLVARLHHLWGEDTQPWLEAEVGRDATARLLAEGAPTDELQRTAVLFDLTSVSTDTAEWITVPIHNWTGTGDFTDGSWRGSTESSCQANPASVRTMVESELQKRFMRGELNAELTTVAFLLGRAQFTWAPERWQMDIRGFGSARSLEAQYPVVIHFAERFSRGLVEPWRTRLKRIRGSLSHRPPEIEWLEHGHDVEPVDATTSSCIGIEAACVDEFEPASDPFIAALLRGVPYIIWPHEDPSNGPAARATIEELVRGGLEGLPERLHRVRPRVAESGVAPRLIWDDEARIPPVLLLFPTEEAS